MSDWPWEVTFEVAFDVNPGDEPDPADWTDLSDRFADRLTTVRGWGRAGQASGSASVRLHNRDRALDPTNTAATFNLKPMRHARLTVTYGATTYPLFRGWVDSWSPSWPEYGQAQVDVRLIDALAWLAMREVDLDLPAQKTGARIAALLDLAGWPAGLRDLDDGVVWLTPLVQDGANIRRAIEDVADAEDGSLWVAADGKVTFRSRHDRLDRTPTLTFGPSGIPVAAVDPSYDSQMLVTLARVELSSGQVFEVEDTAAVDAYGERDLAVRDLDLPDREATGLAQWIVYRLAEPTLWLDAVTVEGRDGPAGVWSVGLGDLVTFDHTPPGGGVVDVDMHVERIRHEVVTGGSWRASFDLSPYFGQGPWFEWLSDEAATGESWLSDVATSGGKWAP